MGKIEKALAEVLEEMVKRRPTPMEIKSMAANVAEMIEEEIDRKVANATRPPLFGRADS